MSLNRVASECLQRAGKSPNLDFYWVFGHPRAVDPREGPTPLPVNSLEILVPDLGLETERKSGAPTLQGEERG